MHAQSYSMTLAVSYESTQPCVTDDGKAVPVGLPALYPRSDRVASDALRKFNDVVKPPLFRGRITKDERALPFDEPAANGAAQ